MNNRTKYCRFRNYILQIQNETFENINVVTSDSTVGKNLELICLDRDHFIKEIPKKEIDCIWTMESFYDTIEIEFGTMIVNEFDKQLDLRNSDYIINGEFAKYKNHIFKSISGHRNDYWFKLMSVNGSSQEIGFIMERPGEFYKCVNQDQIEFAFSSSTFCNYKYREFCVIDANIEGQILIEPFDINFYSENELLEMGFEEINTKLAKWVLPIQTNKIWTKTFPIHNFARFLSNDKVLHDR